MLQLLQLNPMLSRGVLKSLLRNGEKTGVPTESSTMKLNKTNKTTFVAASLLRLHDAMQNLQLTRFVHATPPGQGRFQTCKEAAFSAGSHLAQLQNMGQAAAVPLTRGSAKERRHNQACAWTGAK